MTAPKKARPSRAGNGGIPVEVRQIFAESDELGGCFQKKKNRSKYPSKGLKARSPNFGSTAAQPALQQARGGKTRVEKFRAKKARDESRGEAQRRASPKATLRPPQSALAASPNKKSAASTPRYWLEVSNAESNAISERGKSNERTRAADSVAPWTLSMRPSSHSTESGPL